MLIRHQGTNTIETMRLVLRRFKLEDAEDMFYNWASDPEVCKFLLWGPHNEVEVTRKRIKNWISNYEMNNSYVWAIELKGRNMVVGSISVEITNDSSMTCEVGYCIGKLYWSRGIMTEALRAILHYLFYEIGYQRILAKHDILNVASGRVMQKAGMHFIKFEYHVGLRRDGSYYDLAVYMKNYTDE
ncbi:MAG: GNAT family N-acetyltransferase [Herbinix sp.]|nr:GNAT family N-acetyltransferase [Herbinix sp.]